MKSIIRTGLVITAITIASCTKDEVINVNNPASNSIGFEISTGKTRAITADIDLLKSDANGFGIFATNGSDSELFIDNGKYKYNSANYLWSWEGKSRNWPESEDEDDNIEDYYPINFYAYYPYSETELGEDLLHSYEIAETPELQLDLLAAKNVDILSRPETNLVPLSFKHILSKIDFRVISNEDFTVVIQSIAVKNVGKDGTFDYSEIMWAAAPEEFNTSFSYLKAADKKDNIFAGNTTAVNVEGTSGALMLMPQDLSGRKWDKTIANLNNLSYIEVVYRIFRISDGSDVVGYTNAEDHPMYEELGSTVTGPLFVKVGYPLPTNWLMNKAYKYDIYLDGSSSGGIVIDEDFVDEDGEDSDLPVVDPETEEPIEPEDPIFNFKQIGFDVVVIDWEETDPNNL
ncbi:MAG: fimbrillin family protein [Marinilabiliaceae bacterium]|nr:fimbrillin family protein [Marinilabiliaceae bacterium]